MVSVLSFKKCLTCTRVSLFQKFVLKRFSDIGKYIRIKRINDINKSQNLKFYYIVSNHGTFDRPFGHRPSCDLKYKGFSLIFLGDEPLLLEDEIWNTLQKKKIIKFWPKMLDEENQWHKLSLVDILEKITYVALGMSSSHILENLRIQNFRDRTQATAQA